LPVLLLHVSADEQKKRFLERLDNAAKNWKFSSNDVRERSFWKDYMKAYEDMVCNRPGCRHRSQTHVRGGPS
jgi:polyphosphate kinase 2 (PPK2 family)